MKNNSLTIPGVAGKNKIDIHALAEEWSDYAEITTYLGEECLKINGVKNLILSETIKLSTATSSVVSFDYAADSSVIGNYLYFGSNNKMISFARTFSHTNLTSGETSNTVLLKISFSSSTPIYIKNLQVEEGTTATDYEPYCDAITDIAVQSGGQTKYLKKITDANNVRLPS